MFVFRLERVLCYRERLRDEQARRLREAAARLEAVHAEQETIRREMAAVIRHGAATRQEQVDVSLLSMHAAYLVRQQQRLAEHSERAAVLADEVAGQRQLLVKAQQAVEVLEQLKERRHREWQEQERRRELKALDEIGARRAHHLIASQIP